MKWEYKTVKLGSRNIFFDTVKRELDSALLTNDSDGWELVSISPLRSNLGLVTEIIAVFRRLSEGKTLA